MAGAEHASLNNYSKEQKTMLNAAEFNQFILHLNGAAQIWRKAGLND